jgi:DNA processing protein
MVRYRRLAGPRHEIGLDDPAYPSLMRGVPGAPDLLYLIGDPQAIADPFVSIVGARKATPYGLTCAEQAAKTAAEMGLPVLSGAAIGCDQAAQRKALSLGGRVCAVLGSGADVVYPPGAYDLLENIVASGGAVLSIVGWGTGPARWTFVRRNFVLAAMARLVVIAEAGLPSGTFHTAEDALELEREVAVFPGSIFSPASRGSNYLAAEWPGVGVVCGLDWLEMAYSRLYGALRRPAPCPAQAAPAPADEPPSLAETAMEYLVAAPMRPEALAQSLGISLAECVRLLSGLEVGGRTVRLVDGTYGPAGDEYNRRTREGAGRVGIPPR